MKPFSYERAETPAAAAAAVARTPGAKFIAGGTNLLDLMKLEIEAPAHLVDVGPLKLDRIEKTPEGGMRIGALVTNTALASDDRIRRDYGVLTRAIVAGAGRRPWNQAATAGTPLPPGLPPLAPAGASGRCGRPGLARCRPAGSPPPPRRARRRRTPGHAPCDKGACRRSASAG